MSSDGSGQPERLTENGGNQFPTSLSPDDRTIALFGAGGLLSDIYIVNLDEPGRRQKPIVALASAYEFDPEISPDGKWLAYHSNESGEFQVYVRPFPNTDASRSQVSTTGGTRAAWTRNGRELVYLSKDGDMTTALRTRATTIFTVSLSRSDTQKRYVTANWNWRPGKTFDPPECCPKRGLPTRLM